MHIPVVPGELKDAQVAEFGRSVAGSEGPVLAFCKSGRRAATLWALSQAGHRSVDDILNVAAAAGYDLSALTSKLEEKAAQR